MVHMTSTTLAVENFNFMFCPPDRLVKVEVPVKLWNNDVSPGVKAGGWLHVVNRTVPVLARGWAVKPYFELDMIKMRVKDVLRFRDVEMPEGCQLHAKDPMQPVVRCAARVGGE
jgi:large subunit ribosomal protein L25